MLRIGPEPTDNEISTINIRQDNKRIGILKNPNGKYSLDVSGTINCGALTVNGIRATFDGTNSGLWSISDTDTISYVDGSVGIGTEEPAHELDVSGSVNCSELLVNGTAPTFGGEYVLYDDTYQTSGVSYEEVSANITTTSSGVWDLSDSNTISYTNGNVGIGTTDPAYELDVSGNIYANENIYANGRMYIYDSYLTLDNSVTGATNGIHIKMKHKDATHDARALVVHQDTADILQINYDYDFDTVRINNTVFIDGSCGIGTANPSYELDVSGTINCDELITGTIIDIDGLKIKSTTSDGGFRNNIVLNIGENFESGEPSNLILFANSANTSQTRNFILSRTHTNPDANGIRFGYSSDTSGVILSTIYHFRNDGIATASTWSSTSDERMKFDVNDLSGCLSTIQQLEPKTYLKGDKPNEDRTNQNYLNQESGFLAQDIQKIDTLKHLVSSGSPEIEGVETEMLYLDYGSFIPYLVGAMKEQQIVIDSLTAKNDALQNELTSLKTILQSKGILD